MRDEPIDYSFLTTLGEDPASFAYEAAKKARAMMPSPHSPAEMGASGSGGSVVEYPWLYTQQKPVNQEDILELYKILDEYGMSIKDVITLVKQIHEENEIA